MEQFVYLISTFGYIGITVALIGGIVGLPIPDEMLLTFAGYQVSQENMSYLPTILCAIFGSMAGITISFMIGIKLGLPFLEKFGPKFHITEKRISLTQKYFAKWGPYLLLVCYFIPGIRHIAAYIAAINRYPYRKFAIFAYIGAVVWSITFVHLGKVLGHNWENVQLYLSKFSYYLIILFIAICIFGYVYWKKRR
ncbi:membrane protein DedA with SNARE-associated domain [Oikeobacillus pervagus]|uniref:Membrane protein DedA with SNARE-associated domain n=1 Tax=Oikeobacillus pervagus TaxID=1325931 RepID=A0AAJ1SZW4_9BACI|nr:DedA family protein [Oikeobacillus pervagus]MDQ0215873.1 membrane protein DedA with SNARE-associated domain [Oikeobacillus pervagus]